MLNRIFAERKIPKLFDSEVKGVADFEKRREEIKKILSEKEYGYIPAPPKALSVTEAPSENKNFCAGRATLSRLDFKCVFEDGEFTFPVSAVIPKRDKPCPAFVLINFRPDVPDIYLPTEEIADRGYAVFSFCYDDISVDDKKDADLTDGIGKFLTPAVRVGDAPGKIAMWAWAAMRVMDHIETLDCIDKEKAELIASYKDRCDVWVELGLQTASDRTADIINRGYHRETFEKAMEILKSYDIPVVIHLIVGLPGENMESIKETVEYVNRFAPFGVKIHSIYVMQGTRLAEMYERGEYTPPSMEEYIDSVIYILTHISPDTVVHRLTGDCPRDLLVAPAWNGQKSAIINTIVYKMQFNNLSQGCKR